MCFRCLGCIEYVERLDHAQGTSPTKGAVPLFYGNQLLYSSGEIVQHLAFGSDQIPVLELVEQVEFAGDGNALVARVEAEAEDQ